MQLLQQAKNIWFSENRVAIRSKQAIAAALPRSVLIAIKKRYYSRLLKSATQHLEPDAAALRGLVQQGDFVVDVGAFSGLYTSVLSELVGPTGEVWSIEPIPDTFRILSYCIADAHLQNVRLLNLALSDSCGTGIMEIPRYKDGGETWYDAKLVASSSTLRHFSVRTATLDSLLADNERPVKFIKCDVEYHELPCIRGAMRTIRKWKPILLIEFLRSPDCKGTEQYTLVRLLTEEGYMPCLFNDGNFVERKVGSVSQNIWFLPPGTINLTFYPHA